MSSDYRPRLAFDITDEQRRRIDRLMPVYGTIKNVMAPIIDDLLDLIEQHGYNAVGAIIEQGIKPREVLPSLKKASEL